jgi:hypothetical protein
MHGASCECLQGALAELRLALDDLPEGREQQRLLASVAQATTAQSPHGCLGCDPCNPSDIPASFYRARQACAAASPAACCGA